MYSPSYPQHNTSWSIHDHTQVRSVFIHVLQSSIHNLRSLRRCSRGNACNYQIKGTNREPFSSIYLAEVEYWSKLTVAQLRSHGSKLNLHSTFLLSSSRLLRPRTSFKNFKPLRAGSQLHIWPCLTWTLACVPTPAGLACAMSLQSFQVDAARRWVYR